MVTIVLLVQISIVSESRQGGNPSKMDNCVLSGDQDIDSKNSMNVAIRQQAPQEQKEITGKEIEQTMSNMSPENIHKIS